MSRIVNKKQAVEVGKKLKELRRQKKVTQEDLCKKLGISITQQSRYENGHAMPDLAYITLFCRKLGITDANLIMF